MTALGVSGRGSERGSSGNLDQRSPGGGADAAAAVPAMIARASSAGATADTAERINGSSAPCQHEIEDANVLFGGACPHREWR